MFHSLISSLLNFVYMILDTIFSNDLLTYSFYIGLIGFVLVGIKYLIAFNSSDLGGKK